MSHVTVKRFLAAAIGIMLFNSGCSATLETDYATPRGQSINGIATFIDILKSSGRRVDPWPGVSPQMKREYETLIVFHSDFGPLPEKLFRDTRDFMLGGTIKTLILVVRDSDAAVDYWRQISASTDLSSKDVEEASTSYRQIRAELASKTMPEFSKKVETWYGLKRVDRSSDSFEKPIQCESSQGRMTITARWPLNRRLDPSEEATILWSSGDDPLLAIEKTAFGNIVVVGSATPFLNGGLVDPGNRQLAGELSNLIPASDRVAVAASSNWIDLSQSESPSVLVFLKVHPNGWVFGQGTAALLIFCWWKYPIFGRPRQTVSVETARFGRHVDALGKLLRRTQDVHYARQRIRDWHGTQKSHSDRH